MSKFPFTATGQNVLDIVKLFDSLTGSTCPTPRNWAEFEELRKKYPQLEELYLQFF